jgi:hypothetical protein
MYCWIPLKHQIKGVLETVPLHVFPAPLHVFLAKQFQLHVLCSRKKNEVVRARKEVLHKLYFFVKLLRGRVCGAVPNSLDGLSLNNCSNLPWTNPQSAQQRCQHSTCIGSIARKHPSVIWILRLLFILSWRRLHCRSVPRKRHRGSNLKPNDCEDVRRECFSTLEFAYFEFESRAEHMQLHFSFPY